MKLWRSELISFYTIVSRSRQSWLLIRGWWVSRVVGCLVEWSVDWMVGLLIGRLVSWLLVGQTVVPWISWFVASLVCIHVFVLQTSTVCTWTMTRCGSLTWPSSTARTACRVCPASPPSWPCPVTDCWSGTQATSLWLPARWTSPAFLSTARTAPFRLIDATFNLFFVLWCMFIYLFIFVWFCFLFICLI